MKYLKSINESSGVKMKLKSYCIDNLSYLIDNGFKVKVSKNDENKYTFYEIVVTKGNHNLFKWDEVKYDIIPFLIQLNNDFKVDIEVNGDALDIVYKDGSRGYSMEEVSDVNNDFEELNDVSIYLIRTYIS
jgi:hypothetical protein